MPAYGDDSEFSAWLVANGYVLPVGTPTAAVLRQRGSAYIDATYGARFLGTPTGGFEQERAWPRAGAFLHGQTIPDDVVPNAVVLATYEAAYQEAIAPGSLTAVGSTAARVKREKVEGAVEVEYQTSSGEFSAASMTPLLTSVEGLLAPFLTVAGGIPDILVV